MAKTKEEVQTLAIQQAAGQHGLSWQPSFGSNRMTRGMKLVIDEARKRGVIIQSEADLTQQVIDGLARILIETSRAFANAALNLGAINQEVHSTEYGESVRIFNSALLGDFSQHLRTLNAGITRTMFEPLRPFEIEEKPLTVIQRLLGWDG